eukprot:CAMPEP_0196589154 /NCGR_PEP_ID=MMETSP1081-20130531/62842_1 /TAXON_ID=36882 /ORGANISM="Pyramimonas amylifera, Strain CCMP720" /LENGTH=39 /DNA_ID= /DNA_START= /DNA_END= /DNA_ORIENTATION=
MKQAGSGSGAKHSGASLSIGFVYPFRKASMMTSAMDSFS